MTNHLCNEYKVKCGHYNCHSTTNTTTTATILSIDVRKLCGTYLNFDFEYNLSKMWKVFHSYYFYSSWYHCGNNDLMAWSVLRERLKAVPVQHKDPPPAGQGRGAGRRRGDSHLVVWMKLAAVDVVVVTPECGDQLAGVEAVHGHWASTRHEDKLGAAAAGHCELQPLTALVGNFPVVDLGRPNSRAVTASAGTQP